MIFAGTHVKITGDAVIFIGTRVCRRVTIDLTERMLASIVPTGPVIPTTGQLWPRRSDQ